MNSYLDELFKLKGKTAVVIGAGGHLCSEMARGFARAGCAVAVLDIKLDKAKVVEDDLRAMGFDRVMSTAIDVANKQEHIDGLETILEKFGMVDIVVNGAGINGPTPFLKLELA